MSKYIVIQPIWLEGKLIEPGTADDPKTVEIDEKRAAIPVARGLLVPSSQLPVASSKTTEEPEPEAESERPETRSSRRKSSNS